MRKEDKPFAGTEVAALIESFRNEMSMMAENIGAIRSDMDVLKTDAKELKDDMSLVKAVIRIEIPSIKNRVSALESKIN